MIVGFLLLLIFLVRAGVIWNSAPALLSEAERESEEFRYRYASTPLRRWSVMLGSCLLFAAIFSFTTYAVAFLLWSSFLFAWVESNGIVKLGFFVLVAAAVVALTCIPRARQFFVEACLFFQRYQFFPPLPSRREESLMQQLENLPAGTVPSEVETVLAEGTEPEKVHRRELYETFRKLERVHGQLAELAQSQAGVIKILYFSSEWELIDNQYRAIEQQMHSNSDEADNALMRKTCTCLYYAYGLLTRYLVETSADSREIKSKFAAMGFNIKV